MTWSRFDDAAAKHPKARLAGNDAWGLWQAAVQYCNRYLTDGVVPLAALAVDCLPEPISMAKAKKLADRLVDAKVRDDGAGLFELEAPGRYRVHDFLDWNPSKAQVEAKRKADRDRKRGGPDSDGGSGAPPSRIPSGIPNGKPRDSGPPTPAGARVPAQPSQTLPTGSLTTTPQGTEPPAFSGPGVVVVAGESPKVPCPPDLRLTDAQRATCVTALIPEYAIEPLEQQFRANHSADPSDLRTLVGWRKCLGIHVSACWNDPAKRPPAPGAAPSARPTFQPRNGLRQPNEHDHLDDQAHAAAMGATLE